ncbi:MAG TPA: tripartite tricarboxylate transporter substrate binding protein [Burkholderiales bacterium]|nr:tripartite tricarboxylate transporter substrate binding protein [Burkholderiales bacterium]
MRRILAAAVLGCVTSISLAQPYPARTVQIVVPFTPGTGADILARILGPRLAERWKAAVVVDNRAGATGNIGTDAVAKSAPDGHTLLFTATSFGTNPALSRNLPFDPVKSFAPVGIVATSALAVVVNGNLSVNSMRDLVDLARKQPGKMHYSSPGNGGIQHLTMELLKLEAGFDMVHVPYKGLGGAMSDLVAGHVQAMVSALQSAAPHVQSGKLRMVAVMTPQRSSAFPGVPTLREQGMGELEVETWYGVFAPAGTPGDVIARINSEVNVLLKDPGIVENLARQGMAPAGGPPERLGELVKRELARWNRVVSAAGIKAD